MCIDPTSIELTVEKKVLTVSAERARQWGDDVEEVVVSERPVGTFSRQLFLPRKMEISSSGNGGPAAIRAQSTSS